MPPLAGGRREAVSCAVVRCWPGGWQCFLHDGRTMGRLGGAAAAEGGGAAVGTPTSAVGQYLFMGETKERPSRAELDALAADVAGAEARG